MMKKNIVLISVFSFLCLFGLVSCASTGGAVEGSKATPVENPGAPVEEAAAAADLLVQEVEPRFDDWQYKGFGYDLPSWVDSALDGTISSEFVCFVAAGMNQDQSESVLAELVTVALTNGELDSYELAGSTWVRERASGEYKSIRVYKFVQNK